MAGQGWREWTAGEQLTDVKMQQFLQDQAVMRFADAAARTTALTGVVSEGMITYLDDLNVVEVWDGSQWTELTGDPDIFTQGTAGQYLASLGTAGVEWSTIAGATPTSEGLVFGATNGSNDTTYSLVLGYGSGGALRPSVAFVGNVIVGTNSANAITTGTQNTVLGHQAALSLTTGERNIYIGNTAGTLLSTDNDNTFIGSGAGYQYHTPSSGNTFIGSGAGGQSFFTHTGDNNTLLGQDAVASSTTVSNQITLGNSAITSLRCNVTSISSLSDARDKKDIADLKYGLDFVKTLRPVEFVWNTRIPDSYEKPDGTIKTFSEKDVRRDVGDIGFIAQDLVAAEDAVDGHDVLQLTLRDNPERLEATQGRLIPILVKAIQELSARVEALENASANAG